MRCISTQFANACGNWSEEVARHAKDTAKTQDSLMRQRLTRSSEPNGDVGWVQDEEEVAREKELWAGRGSNPHSPTGRGF